MHVRVRDDFYYRFHSLVLILADAYRTGEALDPAFQEEFYTSIHDITGGFAETIQVVANEARISIGILAASHLKAFKATFGLHSDPREAERAYQQAVDRFQAQMEKRFVFEIDAQQGVLNGNPYLPS